MILDKSFSFLSDLLIISRYFLKTEIIIRILICPKHISESGDIPDRKLKDYFIPLLGGVSVNRYRYISENKCKIRGKKFNGYRGFALFNIKIFENSLEEYLNKYPKEQEFTTRLVASPLNQLDLPIPSKRVHRFQNGNLSHADIIFPKTTAETPEIYYRNFSRILASNSIKLVDGDVGNALWTGDKFSSLFQQNDG